MKALSATCQLRPSISLILQQLHPRLFRPFLSTNNLGSPRVRKRRHQFRCLRRYTCACHPPSWTNEEYLRNIPHQVRLPANQRLTLGVSHVQNVRVEYQTTTFSSPASSHHINLQPPTQVSPTSNTRGSPISRPINLEHTRQDLQPAFHQPASSHSEFQGQYSQYPVKQQPMEQGRFSEVLNKGPEPRSQLELDRMEQEKEQRRKIEAERIEQEQQRRKLLEQERQARQQQQQLQREKQKQEEGLRYKQQMQYQQQQLQQHQQMFNLQQFDRDHYDPQEVQSQNQSPIQYTSQPSQQSQRQSLQQMQFTQPLPQNNPPQAQQYSFSHVLSPTQPTPTKNTSSPEFSKPIPSNTLSTTSSQTSADQLQPPKQSQSWFLLPEKEDKFFHNYM